MLSQLNVDTNFSAHLHGVKRIKTKKRIDFLLGLVFKLSSKCVKGKITFSLHHPQPKPPMYIVRIEENLDFSIKSLRSIARIVRTYFSASFAWTKNEQTIIRISFQTWLQMYER